MSIVLYIRLMDTTTKQTPVQILIDEFGGLRALARAINRDPAAICRWKKSGLIPTSIQKKVLETAWDRGYELTPYDVIFGRD